jgi:hypothetical protein
VAQVLSHPTTDLMAEHFHLSKAHVADIKMPLIDSFLNKLLCKPINEWFERTGIFQSGVTVIHDCLREKKVTHPAPTPGVYKKSKIFRIDLLELARTHAIDVLHPKQSAIM